MKYFYSLLFQLKNKLDYIGLFLVEGTTVFYTVDTYLKFQEFDFFQ